MERDAPTLLPAARDNSGSARSMEREISGTKRESASLTTARAFSSAAIAVTHSGWNLGISHSLLR